MNKQQQWIVALVILLPLFVGGILSLGKSWQPASFLDTSFSKRIGIIRINDVIYESEAIVGALKSFRKDPSISGVVLRVNSPGGGVAPSQEIFAETMRYRDENKPLVVSMDNVAASGGYYVSAGAMRIFANPGTLTGSFGVIMQFPQYFKLLDKIGVSFVTLKAGKFKDIGSPNRAMSAEETKLMDGLLEDTHRQFIADIALGRQMSVDSVALLADGRIFTGSQALTLGFVDTLGSFSDAVSYIKSYVGLPEKSRLEEKKEQKSFWQSILTESKSNSRSILSMLFRPSGMYYLCDIL